MKAETKETIKWIKERLNFNSVKDTTDEKMLEKAIKLLDSLPKLEARLGKGGYIPDKYGTPCKDGDVVNVVIRGKGRFESFLFWDDRQKRFCFQPTDLHYGSFSLSEDYIFEKVKDGSNNN
jgi:hypothetical protein